MKAYLVSLILLALLSALVARGTVDGLRRLNAAQRTQLKEREKVRLEAQGNLLRDRLLAARLPAPHEESYAARYGPHLRAMRDFSAITQQVNREAEALLLPVQEQKTETIPVSPKDPAPTLPVFSYTISVSGELPRVLTWLGHVEQRFPLARVERVEFQPAEDWVVLRCTLHFPRPLQP